MVFRLSGPVRGKAGRKWRGARCPVGAGEDNRDARMNFASEAGQGPLIRCQSAIRPPKSGATRMTITVYSKPSCVQCTATTRALDARGLPYEVIDLTEDADAMAAVMAMGYRQAPVVVAGEAHWAGFRPDMIGQLAS